MAEKRTLPPLSSFFKPNAPVSDADPALASMPEIDYGEQDSMDVAGPGPLPAPEPTIRYNGFDANQIDKIYCEARKTMQIRVYGNRHDGSKILNGTVTVPLDEDLEPNVVEAYQTSQARAVTRARSAREGLATRRSARTRA